MYRISFINKFAIMSVYVFASIVVMLITENLFTDIVLISFGMVVYFYISGICIYFCNGFIVRKSGKVFNRKHYIMLKNIQGFQIIRFSSVITLIVIYLNNHKSYIFGFDARQAREIENIILMENRYNI